MFTVQSPAAPSLAYGGTFWTYIWNNLSMVTILCYHDFLGTNIKWLLYIKHINSVFIC